MDSEHEQIPDTEETRKFIQIEFTDAHISIEFQASAFQLFGAAAELQEIARMQFFAEMQASQNQNQSPIIPVRAMPQDFRKKRRN